MMKTFQKGAGDYYLTYPCNYDDLPHDIRIVNGCNGKHHGVPRPYEIGSSTFEEEANMLVRVAMDVERDKWPDYYFDFCEVDSEISPVLRSVGLNERDPKGCANAVRMDQPSELWSAIVRYSQAQGIPVASDKKGIRFLERHVDGEQVFGANLGPAMHNAFEVKYYYGVARPEEYFDSANFAHYPEGCPPHPSYIAGHGTVGGVANKTFREVFPEASDKHFQDVETATLQFAHFRDLARVHTRQDSYQGWAFGNRCE